MKNVALLLLLVNCMFGYYIFSRDTGSPALSIARTDLNPDKLRVVPLAALGKSNPSISSTPRTVVAVPSSKPEASASTCLEWGKIEAADAERARKRLAFLGTAVDQYTEQRFEEPTRFWVYIGNVPDAAEAARILSRLRQSGIKDAFSQPDHSISLALYASEELAKGYQAQLLTKGFFKVAIEPRALQVKEVSFLIRDPDPKLAAQLSEAATEFKTGQVRQVVCPIEAGKASVAKPS